MTATNAQLEAGQATLLLEVQNRRGRIKGTADPSAGAGVAAPFGIEYDQYNVGYTTLLKVWRKMTAANTGWVDVSAGGGGGGGGTAATTTFDDAGLPITAANVQVALQETLKRTGVVGTWDMTGAAAGTVPDAGHDFEASTATVTAAQYLVTPASGSSPIKLAGSAEITKQAGYRSARLKASTSGGNFVLSGLVFTNAEATPADVLSAVGAGVLATGTCTHIALVALDNSSVFGGGASSLVLNCDDPVGGQQNEGLAAGPAYVAGDEVYCSFDSSTGVFKLNVNAGGDITATVLWDVSGAAALRVHVLGYFGTSTPSLPDTTFDFDPSDNTGGRTGFQTVGNPVVPAGAADGQRFLVSVAGSYNGRSAVVGDIVEFHSSLAVIQILPATPLSVAAAEALINPYITANPSAVNALITAYLAATAPVAKSFDVEVDYALVGGSLAGEFAVGPTMLGATIWASGAATVMSAIGTYELGYVPAVGDSFSVIVSAITQSFGFVPSVPWVATNWDFSSAGATLNDFMRTVHKKYDFTFSDYTGGQPRWTLENPDVQLFSSAIPLSMSQIITGANWPGLFFSVEQTTDVIGEISVNNEAAFTLSGVAPFRPGEQTKFHILPSSLGAITVVGNTGAGPVTLRSDLPVMNDGTFDYVTIGGTDVTIVITYLGSNVWHVSAERANEAGLVTVRHKRDLPKAVANIITLAAGKFHFAELVDLGSNRINITGDIVLTGIAGVTGVTQSGTGKVITVTDCHPRLRDMRIEGQYGVEAIESAGVAVLDLKGVNFGVAREAVTAAATVGSISLVDCDMASTTPGYSSVKASYNPTHVLIKGCKVKSQTGGIPAIDLAGITAGALGIDIIGNDIDAAGGTTEGIDLTGATLTDDCVRLIGNNVHGSGAAAGALIGVSPHDKEVISRDNLNIADTDVAGNLNTVANATATTIASTATRYKAAGTTVDGVLHRFTSPADNKLVYTGKKTQKFRVTVVATATCGTANQVWELSVHKNDNGSGGGYLAHTVMQGKLLAAGDPSTVVSTSVIELSETDFLEAWVRNITAANDITIVDLQITVTRV
jgi:hypothetical protein